MLSKAIAAACFAGVALATYPSDEEMGKMYLRFVNENDRWSNDASRMDYFKANVKEAIDKNREQNVTCTDLFDDENCVFGVTKFSDRSPEEFKRLLGFKPSAKLDDVPVLNMEELTAGIDTQKVPSVMDWCSKGALTPIKNQGYCGSCWVFATASGVESAVFMATGSLPSPLSTQELVSCDNHDSGCDGGDTTTALNFVKKNGLDSEIDYPYSNDAYVDGKTDSCKNSKVSNVAAEVSSWSWAISPCESGSCSKQDEDALAAVVAAKGPLPICVYAHPWHHYKGGVLTASCSAAYNDMDHCVQLVSYNKEASTPYWIVRNSCGDWGQDHGYIFLEYGKNKCSVASWAIVPVATSTGPALAPAPSPSPSSSCATESGYKCHFPFTYNGVTYDACTFKDESYAWCATQSEYDDNHWDWCSSDCPQSSVVV